MLEKLKSELVQSKSGPPAKVNFSANIYLRRTTEDDLDFVLSAEQNKENCPFVSQWQREQHQEALSNQDLAHLIIVNATNGKPVGYVLLAGLENTSFSIEFRRIVITDKNRGHGREALRLIKELAFVELRAHRLWLDVKDHNLRARHLYESEGFVVEGVLRECVKVGDLFESLIVMSILCNEYH